MGVRLRGTGPLGGLAMNNEVTCILSAIEQGDPQAAEQLLPLVYDELRKLAAQKLAQEKPGQTLQATALVHEAYLRLVDADAGPALEQPRPLLRRRGRGHAPHPRRERPPQAAPASAAAAASASSSTTDLARPGRRADDLLALDEALDRLGRRGPRRRELVKLRFFAGLTIARGRRSARASPRATAERDWAYARAWLLREPRWRADDRDGSVHNFSAFRARSRRDCALECRGTLERSS